MQGIFRNRGEVTMRVTQKVKKILANYESDRTATKANTSRVLYTGKFAGTGKMVIFPVDEAVRLGCAATARSSAATPSSGLATNPSRC
jgi:fructose-bisphosphate aldolase, class I